MNNFNLTLVIINLSPFIFSVLSYIRITISLEEKNHPLILTKAFGLGNSRKFIIHRVKNASRKKRAIKYTFIYVFEINIFQHETN